MRRKPGSFVQQLISALTILSFIFTQAVPAYALRESQEDKTLAQLETILKRAGQFFVPGGAAPGASGQEEYMLPQGFVSPPAPPPTPHQVAIEALKHLRPTGAAASKFPELKPGEVPAADLVAAIWAGLGSAPAGQQDLPGKVSVVLGMLQTFLAEDAQISWQDDEIRQQMQEVIVRTPAHCPTCAARGLTSLVSTPDYHRPEDLQKPELRDAETMTALLIALDVWLGGRVLTVDDPDGGHPVFANSMAASQLLYQASELGVPLKNQRTWSSRAMTLDQLKEAAQRMPVVVHAGGNHYVHVVAADASSVTYRELTADANGTLGGQDVTLTWAQFEPRWKGSDRRGFALLAMPPREHSIPGRQLGIEQAKAIVGCCGVTNASGIDWKFSRSLASQMIVRVLESRGFDNFANSRKFEIELPADFDLGDPRYSALRTSLSEILLDRGQDTAFFEGNGQPPRIRFFGTSRGVGSSTANEAIIEEEIQEQVLWMARALYGDDTVVIQDTAHGHWNIQVNHVTVNRILELGAADHTRYKTAGGDRAANAHHLPWKGVSLGFNGDWEGFEWFKALLVVDHEEPFEGTNDAEPMNHVLGDLTEVKDGQGRVIGHVPLEQSIQRTFRLMENMEALRKASMVLDAAYGSTPEKRAEQALLRRELEERGINPDELVRTADVGGYEIPVLIRDRFNAAINDPTLMDQVASSDNNWVGYHNRLGQQLTQTSGNHFDNPKALNISINVMSLWDDHSAVAARSYDKATAFYFGFGRDQATGELQRVLGGSEVRGLAPLIGTADETFEIREGITDLINGRVEQLEAQEWSVYTVDETAVTRHDVWNGDVETDVQGEETRVKWTKVRPGQEAARMEWTNFREETQAQPVSLFFTLDGLTEQDPYGSYRPHFAEATDPERETSVSRNLNEALANPDTKVFGGGSGTSFHALLLTQARHNIFDGLQSSDLWLSALVRNLIRAEVAQGRPPIFVVVSQSGETGAAKALVRELIELGAIVLGITNRPGSSVYRYTKTAGGVIVTESVDEMAVAATGSNSSQAGALDLFGMKRREAIAPESSREDVIAHHSQRIKDLISLTTHVVPGGDGQVHRGALQTTLDSFEAGEPNHDTVQGLVAWVKQGASEIEPLADRESFRKVQLIITGIGSRAQAIAPEVALKVMEVTRKMASFVPLQELLAYGVSDQNPLEHRTRLDAEAAALTLEENLKQYTTGGRDFVGNHPYFPTLRKDDPWLTGASEVLLLGDGEDQVELDYIVARYQVPSPIPLKRALYAAAPKANQLRKKALVIAIQPWTEPQSKRLEAYRKAGATVVIVASANKSLVSLERERAEQEGLFLAAQGDAWAFARHALLNLFMMRVMESSQRGTQERLQDLARQDRRAAEAIDTIDLSYTEASFQRQQVAALAEQAEGIREVDASFTQPERGARPHRNLVALQRMQRFAAERGWDRFEWWVTGKGVRYAAARDLSLQATAQTGKLAEPAEASEFKHGRYAATHDGDIFINYWSPRGTPDWGDDVKTALKEVVPRLADHPYPVQKDEVPGMVVLVAAEDDGDPYLKALSGSEYSRLRAMRREADEENDTVRPDIVLTTPHGGFLESLTLNRRLSEGMADGLASYLEDQNTTWEKVMPRTVLALVDNGERLPDKQELYQAARRNFSGGARSQILAVAPTGNRMADTHSDAMISVNNESPIAFLVVGHQLTTLLVEARFERVLKWEVELHHALAEDMERGADGTIGRFAPELSTPGELLMHWALGHDNSTRALRAFAEANTQYATLEQDLLEIMSWYNLDPIKGMGAAGNLNELWHATVDLIEKVAKVVTNFSGVRMEGPAKEAISLGLMRLAATDAAAFERLEEGVAAALEDPEAVEQLKAILADTVGVEGAGLEEAANPVERFVEMAAPRLAEAVVKLRAWYPDLPGDMPITVQLLGADLAHGVDGKLYVNANVFRHPLLLLQQLEHEALHERMASVVAVTELHESLVAVAEEHSTFHTALREVVVLFLEMARFRSYSPEKQHEVLEVLGAPNVMDVDLAFEQLLKEGSALRADAPRIRRILEFLLQVRPKLEPVLQALLAHPEKMILGQLTALVRQMAAGQPPVQALQETLRLRPSNENSVGPLYLLHATGDSDAVTQDVNSWERALNALASIVNSLVGSGAVGAVEMPANATTLADLGDPAEPSSDRANLDGLALFLRTRFANSAAERAAELMGVALLPPYGNGVTASRLADFSVTGQHVLSTVAVESAKSALTGNYAQPLKPGETGSGVVGIVAKDDEAASWALPARFRDTGEEPLRAYQIVGYLPPEVLSALETEAEQEDLRALLNPLPSAVVDAVSGRSPLEEQLESWAQHNGIPADAAGRPDLRYLLVRGLSRDHQAVYAEELRRLEQERGLQVDYYSDGTVIDAVAAGMPPKVPGRGFTSEDPLQISFTGTWAAQATVVGRAIGGKALPRGACCGIRYLPQTITAGTPAEPLAHADDFSSSAQQVLREWKGDLGDQIHQGQHLIHADFTGETIFLFLPTTDVGVDLNLTGSIGEIRGIPGAHREEGAQPVLNYYALMGHQGVLFVQQASPVTQEKQPGKRLVDAFQPPMTLRIRPENEAVAFRRQAEIWMQQWRSDQGGAVLRPGAVESLVEQLVALFGQFRASGNRPQVAVADSPLAESEAARSPLLLTVSLDRRFLLEDLQSAVRPMGANFRMRDVGFREDINVVIADIRDVSMEGLQAVAGPLQHRLGFVQHELEATNDPGFTGTLPFEMETAWESFNGLLGTGIPVVRVSPDPSSERSSLVFFSVPVSELFEQVEAVALQVLSGEGVDASLVVMGGGPLYRVEHTVEAADAHIPQGSNVTVYAYQVEAAMESAPLSAVAAQLGTALSGLAGGAAQPLALPPIDEAADELSGFLQAAPMSCGSTEAAWLVDVYRSYRAANPLGFVMGDYSSTEGDLMGLVFLVGALPYHQPDNVTQEPQAAMNAAVSALEVEVQRSFLTSHSEVPDGPQYVVFYIAVNQDQMDDVVRDAVETALVPYVRRVEPTVVLADAGSRYTDALSELTARSQWVLDQPGAEVGIWPAEAGAILGVGMRFNTFYRRNLAQMTLKRAVHDQDLDITGPTLVAQNPEGTMDLLLVPLRQPLFAPEPQDELAQSVNRALSQLPGAGLEEVSVAGQEETAAAPQFLTWAEEIAAANPIAALRDAISNSVFLQAIRAVNLTRGPSAWKAADQLRQLRSAEIRQLVSQGNRSDDWTQVRIDTEMTPEGLAQIEDNRFEGRVEIGQITPGTVTLPVSKAVRPRGIRNSTLHNARIGANVLIENADLIQNYVVKDNSVVRKTELIKADPGTTFGLDKAYEVRNEYGKREMHVFPEMKLQDAVHFSERLGSDAQFEGRYNKAHQRYLAGARSDWGVVEEDAVIDSAGEVVNVYVGKGAILRHTHHVRNAVVMSGFTPDEEKELRQLASGYRRTPQLLVGMTADKIKDLRDGKISVAEYIEGEQTRIEDGAQVDDSVFQPGVHVASSAQLRHTFMMEHTIAEEGVKVFEMYVGPDSLLATGEFRANILEAAVVSHHQPTSVLGSWVGIGTNFGSGTKFANHDGMGPDLETQLGVGTFTGTGVVFQNPVNLVESPHILLQTGIQISGRQRVVMPFALMGAPEVTALAKIGAKQRPYNEVVPGWVLRYLPYMLFRNEDKWSARQNALRHRFNYEIFQPETADLMIEARSNLVAAAATEGADDGEADGKQIYIGETEMTGLGNNYMTNYNREKGIETYTKFIRYYAAAGLFRELQRLSDEDKLTRVRVRNLIRRPSQNRRWEHERQILLLEFDGQSISTVLEEYDATLSQLAEQVKGKLDDRAEDMVRTHGDHAQGILDTGERNSFVRKKLAPKLQAIETTLLRWSQRLDELNANYAIGMEEPTLPTLPSTSAAIPGVAAVVANQTGPGLSIGVGLEEASDVPVAFVTTTPRQTRELQELGIDSMYLFPASDFGGFDGAVSAATEFLAVTTGGQVVTVGVSRPVGPLAQLLEGLFGIQLTQGALSLWQNFVNKVDELITAA